MLRKHFAFSVVMLAFIAMATFSVESPMSNRAEAMELGTLTDARNTAGSINIIELVQYAPEPRSQTEYGTLRSGSRPQPACHWERNYKTGTSAWVCRTKEKYDAAPRYPRVVPRY